MKYSDGTVIDSNYGSTTNPPSNVFYPTINTSLGDSTTGTSSSAGVKKLKYTKYDYYGSSITNTSIQSILFNGGYWLASRCIIAVSSCADLDVRRVVDNSVFFDCLCSGYSSKLSEYTSSYCAVRPVVSLKSNVIDISSADENSGKDGHAWNLK